MLFAKYGQAVLVSHERRSRLLVVSRQPNKAADPVATKLTELFRSLPKFLRRTITFDNGTEFSYHYRLHKLSMRTFFCDPHAPCRRAALKTPSDACAEDCRGKLIWPRCPINACSPWCVPIITLRESVLTTKPRQRFSAVTCCTSNVNPPSGFHRHDDRWSVDFCIEFLSHARVRLLAENVKGNSLVTMTASPDKPIEMSDDADFVHTGPGTPSGRYMRMFWHPVYV